MSPLSPAPPSPIMWSITNGAEGFERQCRGVAKALGWRILPQHIQPTYWSKWLAPYGGVVQAQWHALLAQRKPDIVLASGRHAIPYARALKQKWRHKIFVTILQHPHIGRKSFDLIWVPQHDKLAGANVMRTLTSPHDIDEANRAREAKQLLTRLPPDFPTQRVGVLLGGPNRAYAFRRADMEILAKQLVQLASQGWGILCALSRRTPSFVAPLLQELLPTKTCFMGFPSEQDNPYIGILGLSDCFLVTADSVNMLGEAASTGRAVHIVALRGGRKKFQTFHNQLIATGAARPFSGQLANWAYSALNSTQDIAARLRQDYERYCASHGHA